MVILTLLNDRSEAVPLAIGQFEEAFPIAHIIVIVEFRVDVDTPENGANDEDSSENSQPRLKRDIPVWSMSFHSSISD